MATVQSTSNVISATQPRATSSSHPGASLKSRFLTVGDYQPSERRFRNTRSISEKTRIPMSHLRLIGRWLDEAGFPIGAKVRVDVVPGRLTIEVLPDSPEQRAHLPRRGRFLL